MNRCHIYYPLFYRIWRLLSASLVFVSGSYSREYRVANKIIHHQKVIIPCDVKRAFQMFTISKNVEQWLTVKADIVPVAGGIHACFWNPKDRKNNSAIGCMVTVVEKNKPIAFDWCGPVQFKPFMNDADPLTPVVMAFVPIDTGIDPRTEVYLIRSGWRSGEDWEQTRLFFERAQNLSFID